MGKVTAGLFVSLDGVAESPEKWHLAYFNEEMEGIVGASMTAADTLLLGRVTYEEWATFWPQQEGPLADYMNNTRKLVASSTLSNVEWQNSSLIKGDVIEEVRKLREQPGQTIGINGSIALVRSLVHAQLVDELVLLVHPVVIGEGKKLFVDDGRTTPLSLLDSKTLSTGVVALTYGPGSPAV